jgi:phosphoribosylaminoimidazolecarboxamide formyltransferase/IMP cyclohydrolase
MESPRINRALVSVSDKLGLAGLVRGLVDAGTEVYSTGGTGRFLQKHGLPVLDVSTYTGFPEMMAGRLKTLHPKVFGGILGRLDRPEDRASQQEHSIKTFELVVVNLYPFEATIARPGTTHEEAIEQIDIGGPSLIRAAAKNYLFVTIATDPAQYAEILEQITVHGRTSVELRERLASAAFARTAEYDQAIADYFVRQTDTSDFPLTLRPYWRRKCQLRYGENPHQRSALYVEAAPMGATLATARQLHGKDLSYNNLLDLDAALAIVRSLARPSAAVIKHNNPCGAASAQTLVEATRKALEGDPLSAFGSVVGLNRPLDAETADVLSAPGQFIEAILAPALDEEAIRILTTRPKWKANVRLIEVGQWHAPGPVRHFQQIDGGLLVQDADTGPDPQDQWQVATQRRPTDEQLGQLRFAWEMVRHVKSNAIVLARDDALCGVGAGQMSRVDSVQIAISKAGERARGAVLASDAFFPFADSIHKAAQAGISAIIQPGGSKQDDEVIAATNEHAIPMIVTGRRHFKH